MKRKGPFKRDIELHGHHKDCPAKENNLQTFTEDLTPWPCTCVELDHDDWIAAGEAEMDRRREEPRERVDYND